MSKSPDNMEHRTTPPEQGSTQPLSKEERRRLKKQAAKGAQRQAAPRGEQREQKERDVNVEAEKESLKQEILAAPDFAAAEEIFQTLNEGRLTNDEFAELMIVNSLTSQEAEERFKKLEEKGYLDRARFIELMKEKQLNRGEAQPEIRREAQLEETAETPTETEQELEQESSQEEIAAAEPISEATETTEAEDETADQELAAASETDLSAEEKAALAFLAAEAREKPVEKTSASADAEADTERDRREEMASRFFARAMKSFEARAKAGSPGGAVGVREKEGKGVGKGRTRKARRPGREGEEGFSAEAEFSAEDLLEELPEGFERSPELEQKFLESSVVRTEAEALWENVRNQPWGEAILAYLEMIARKEALAGRKFREAKIAEAGEIQTFLETPKGARETAPKRMRWGEKVVKGEASEHDIKMYLLRQRAEPPKFTIEEMLGGGKQGREKAGIQTQLTLLKNVRKFVDLLRLDRQLKENEKKYSNEDYDKKMAAIWKIFHSDDVQQALARALENESLNQEEYDHILAGLSPADTKKEAAEEKLNVYFDKLEDRWYANELTSEDQERLQAAAKKIFMSGNPGKEAERAVADRAISPEEKDEVMEYVGGIPKKIKRSSLAAKETEIKNQQVRKALEKLDALRETPEVLARLSAILLDLADSDDAKRDLEMWARGFRKRGALLNLGSSKVEGGDEEVIKISRKDYEKLAKLLSEAETE